LTYKPHEPKATLCSYSPFETPFEPFSSYLIHLCLLSSRPKIIIPTLYQVSRACCEFFWLEIGALWCGLPYESFDFSGLELKPLVTYAFPFLFQKKKRIKIKERRGMKEQKKM